MGELLINCLYAAAGALLWAIFSRIYRKTIRFRFKRVFGQDADRSGGVCIVSGALALPQVYDADGKLLPYPYFKPQISSRSTPYTFLVSNPIGASVFRGANYFSTAFASVGAGSPALLSDETIENSTSPLDRSFVSLGGHNNYKTIDTLEEQTNHFVSMTHDVFFEKSDKDKKPLFTKQDGYDYGLILRLRPHNHTNRVWIVCAGFGEWGTSGAAWYLANRWKKLLKANKSIWMSILHPSSFFKGRDFATIVKVKPGYDESAEPILHFRHSKDVKRAVEKHQILLKSHEITNKADSQLSSSSSKSSSSSSASGTSSSSKR